MAIFKLSSGKARISIECELELGEKLQACVFSALLRPARQPAPIHYRILHSDERFLLYRNERLTHRNRQLDKILYAIEWQIVADWTHLNRRSLIFHGAVLTKEQKGYVFIGGSGTGKTSFSIFLMRHGFELLSDEFACIQIPSLKLLPFPRNFIIKPHLSKYLDLPRLQGKDSNYRQNTLSNYLAPFYFGNIARSAATISKIFFLKPVEGHQFHIDTIPENQAFIELLQNSFNPQYFKSQLPDLLIKILNRAATFYLESSNPLGLNPANQKRLLTEILS